MAIQTVTEDGEESILTGMNPEDRLPHLIGSMREGTTICFEYGGLKVGIENGSLVVWDPETGDYLGGRLLLKSATISGIEGWLDSKVSFYGVKA